MTNQNANQFGPLKLPTGKIVFFREPTGGDRLAVLQDTPINEENVYSANELVAIRLAAKCLTQVDGEVPTDSYKFMFTNWSDKDVIYYKNVFNKVRDTVEAGMSVEEAVDFLLGRSGSGTSTTATTQAAAQ
ncbi:hypothetical protein [Tumebacillus flagellatus]|uniref:Uncharacterized protein n=1 Tax=Tumebacillus flagellatus TaxID=1157490 RepID=A0A074LKB8_9BACL|nr:hypothetical protein [Tumebacillus flagellatus]KEO81035.1 hypothetical protein EL26_22920 [Tumebacillus flagellatus]